MIRETPQEFLDILKSYVPDTNKPAGVARQEFSEFFTEFQSDERPAVEPVAIRDDLRGVWCSVPGAVPDRTLLFFHGGFFSVGSTADHLGFCAELARAAQARVFSVDYRLAPEHPFPAQAEDALAAYRFLARHGCPPHRIIPVGLSSGGTLVLDLLLSLRDQHLLMPPAAICMSPMVDLSFGGDSVTRNQASDWLTAARLAAIRTQYLAGSDPGDLRASPVHANLSGFPGSISRPAPVNSCLTTFLHLQRRQRGRRYRRGSRSGRVCFTSGRSLVNRCLRPAMRLPVPEPS